MTSYTTKFFKAFTVLALSIALLGSFNFTLANTGSAPDTSNTNVNSSSSCGTATANQLPNPLKVCSVQDILYLIVDIATYIGVILAVLALIFVGFKFIAAQGNPEKIKEARSFFLYVVIGIAILIGARAIIDIIKTTLTSAGVVQSNVFNGH